MQQHLGFEALKNRFNVKLIKIKNNWLFNKLENF